MKKLPATPRAAQKTVKTDVAAPVSAHDIGHRAYGLFQARGGQHGLDVQDWLQAEADLLSSSQTATSVNPSKSRAKA
jgi:Protein of unknown function (DUF2934)